MDVKISAVVLANGDLDKIIDCLDGLKWCNEIIVIHDVVENKVLRIIKNKKFRFDDSQIKIKGKKLMIFKRRLDNNFAEQRNFGLKKASNEWVFFVDNDEVVTDELREEIKIKLNDKNILNKFSGFYLKRKDFFLGKWLNYGETGNIKLLRLARKNMGRWEGRVHEVWKIKGKMGELDNPLKHFPHKNISSFLQKINWYTDIVAQYWKEEKRKIGFWEIVIFPAGKFLQNYFFRLGILDGIQGLIFAIIMSFHSFLARAKLWQKSNDR